ncbi:nucleoside recognition domain-containing protein [Garciella nitratireducens]|uniref:Spore maturation protein A n=1 Tax=Garciella nitratireducens DSM 15102 TaxID=1121911 RepID=A0A1T4MEV1_9FIRM|nr:nucleoside recognition domain-containing protein [Garciella nitratireducens]RBP39895.1 spore maturation protein A [Garciella nitratireducens]SJZ65298.1 spore maturation protein A [Garciella nitratireducens DSM 15102]
MINILWFFMIGIGIIVGLFNGRLEAITHAAMDSAQLAVEMCMGFIGIWALWLGLMNVAQKSGVIYYLSKLISPVLKILFPDVPKNHPAMGAMIMNMAANMMGLGNAATPLGLKAMEELQKLNDYKNRASNAMCTFLVINTSSIQLIPTTVIALRMSAGSNNPTEIIGTSLIATTVSTIVGILSVRLLEKRGEEQ